MHIYKYYIYINVIIYIILLLTAGYFRHIQVHRDNTLIFLLRYILLSFV